MNARRTRTLRAEVVREFDDAQALVPFAWSTWRRSVREDALDPMTIAVTSLRVAARWDLVSKAVAA